MNEKTNNFDEVPHTRELWVKIEEYKLRVAYKDNKWFECIQNEDNPEIFLEKSEDMQGIYTHHALDVCKIYARISNDKRIDFAGRELCFGKEDGEDVLIIQTGGEETLEGMESPSYPCDVVCIDRKKWIEIMKFFELASALFLNWGDFSKELRGLQK